MNTVKKADLNFDHVNRQSVWQDEYQAKCSKLEKKEIELLEREIDRARQIKKRLEAGEIIVSSQLAILKKEALKDEAERKHLRKMFKDLRKKMIDDSDHG